jgi:multicomponent Na+:H+ antiporter subunit G
MILRQILVNVFLWLGVALVLMSCLGVLVFPSVYDRLHFTSPVTLGAICIAIAVLIHEDFSLVGNKALLIAVFMLCTAPLITHATGRAARYAERDDWRPGEDEDIEVEER